LRSSTGDFPEDSSQEHQPRHCAGGARGRKTGISLGVTATAQSATGIPAKSFAIVATDSLTLEEGMAKYEPKEVDITIAVDDTLCKGVESWAWYGLQQSIAS